MQEIFSHPIPAVAILLGALIFFHELGHYLVGRMCGIAVEIFSIGFGPTIIGFKRGDTQYKLCAIPLGGFVKFYGSSKHEDIPFQVLGKEYFRASVGKRALTVAAGPIANFLFALLVYFGLASNGIQYPPAIVGEVLPGSRAEAADLHSGDQIRKINNVIVKTWPDIDRVISKSPEKELEMIVERAGQMISIQIKPAATVVEDIFGKKSVIGRTGIGLSYSPATLTFISKDSPLLKAGLKTGDTISEIRIPNSESFSPRSFEDLVRFLMKARAANNDQAVFVLKESKKEISFSPKTLPDTNLLSDLRPRAYATALGIRDSQLTLAATTESGLAGLKPNDLLLKWEDKEVVNLFDLNDSLVANKTQDVEITVLRDFQRVPVKIKLKPQDIQKPSGVETVFMMPVTFVGQLITPPMITETHSNILSAFWYGVTETAKQTGGMVVNLAQLISGDIPLKTLGGPILIAKVAGDSAKAGLQSFLTIAALISINLGVVNLFPIPVLDGGQLVLLLVERLKRRPLSEIAIENFQKVGFVLIFSLVIVAMYNDLSRFWKSMLESIMGSFQ